MTCRINTKSILSLSFIFCLALACNNKSSAPSKETISQVQLKTGPVINCGPPDKQFGSTSFANSCQPALQKDFNMAIALLHSFEYDEAEKVFAGIIDKDPACAMAFWGVAMCSFHALWTPPSDAELAKGARAIDIAAGIQPVSARETAYINALSAFYKDWQKADHRTRCLNYEKAMEQVHNSYPDDKEAAVFYALALDAAADPADKTFANQKKAGAILNALYPAEPNHPGIIHYIIHTYDYPGLATAALPAARKYAQVAPSSSHALHMPSHIFTRLGLWDECIQSNLAAVSSAQCYAKQAGLKAHWDEELHGIDYLVYAYLQKGNNELASHQRSYLLGMEKVKPVNFKVAYCFAAVPSRILLENHDWQGAAALVVNRPDLNWAKFPWQAAIIHFTRLLGAVHTGQHAVAEAAMSTLQQLHDTLLAQKDAYKANQVAIQIASGKAWISFMEGKKEAAIAGMLAAAGMEDATEKHPVTPGEVLPARELLADMYFAYKDYSNARSNYEAVLKKTPNRFNSLYGAGKSAEKLGDTKTAATFYQQLLKVAPNSDRPELAGVKQLVARK